MTSADATGATGASGPPGSQLLAELLRLHRQTVVLTGAGVSTESGIPDFRSRDTGLWNRIDPMEYLSATALRTKPAVFWRCFDETFASGVTAGPNQAHFALAELEKAGYVRAIVTQNIDGLHQKAGSRRVIEVHGHLRTASCQRCGKTIPLGEALAQVRAAAAAGAGGRPAGGCPARQMPPPGGSAAAPGRPAARDSGPSGVPACSCGGLLRPDVVLFEDPMPEAFEEAWRLAAAANLVLVVGSSLTVWPAASLAECARRLAIVNLEPTPFDRRADVVVRGKAGEVLGAVAGVLVD